MRHLLSILDDTKSKPMKAPIYHTRFVGGPSDGVVVVASSFQFGEKLWMPASPPAHREDCNDAVQSADRHYRSVYRMAYKHHALEDSCPTVRCDYVFSGFECLETMLQRSRVSRSKQPWLTRLVSLISPERRWKLWHPLPEGRPS